jgi:hypothetical protein
MRAFVLTDFDVEGMHHYPTPPKEVKFLQYPHRHMFNIKAEFEVTDLDREIEIFLKETEIKTYLHLKYGTPCIFNNMSCEMIALDILNEFNASKVIVLEDGRGGARVEL